MSLRRRVHAPQLIAVGVSGLGIGWLTGVSASPVISIVLASILAVSTAVIATLAGLDARPESDFCPSTLKPNAWPVAVLIIGVICGAMIGIRTRVNEWIGPGPAQIARRWRAAGLNLSTEAIVKRV